MRNLNSLEKLKSRTLGCPTTGPDELRKNKEKQTSRTEKKLRYIRRNEIKSQRSGLHLGRTENKLHRASRPSIEESAEPKEQQQLKQDIFRLLQESDGYVKRSTKPRESSWEGLTPGLAPIGYNPDESEDDDPY